MHSDGYGLMGLAGELREGIVEGRERCAGELRMARGAYAESAKQTASKMGTALQEAAVMRELNRLNCARTRLVEAGQELELRLRLVLDVHGLEESREEAAKDGQCAPAARCDLVTILRQEAEAFERAVAALWRLTEHIAL